MQTPYLSYFLCWLASQARKYSLNQWLTYLHRVTFIDLCGWIYHLKILFLFVSL